MYVAQAYVCEFSDFRAKKYIDYSRSSFKRGHIARVSSFSECIFSFFGAFYVYLLSLFWALLPEDEGLLYISLK